LQVERYSRACKPGEDTYRKYQEIVDAASEQSVPLVVRRRDVPPSDSLVGTARLELPSATTIEAVVRFQPDTLAASVLAQRTYAEVGVFATRSDLAWWEVLDVMDTVASAVVQLAEEYKIKWLWIFPRLTMMSLLLAEIPDLLPPYRFALCTDVAGWNETSDTLQKIRALGMKELPVSPGTLPVVIQITPEQWAADLKERLALQEQRRQRPDLPRLLRAAMRQAHQRVEEQVAQLHTQTDKEKQTMLKSGKKETESAPITSAVESAPVEPPVPPAEPAGQEKRGFLPFVVSGQEEASYLRQVVEQGGAAANSYKTLSYELLQLKPGMQVLDVGCGIGVDLPALADRVGTGGLVIGLDHDSNLLRTAREANTGRSNVRLVVAEAQELPFPNRSFDGVRADRVLQYIPELAQVLAEMVRVLRPGGILTLIEPDWRTIALFPASPAGGDDDQTWSAVVQLCQRRLPHALIGRQLAALLHQQGEGVWDEVHAQVVAYTFPSWQVTNTLLQVSNLAQALAQEEPTRAGEITTWLQAVEAAAQRGEFFACVPLFFAHARKAANT
jgi:SAM-dependent methyltransferase